MASYFVDSYSNYPLNVDNLCFILYRHLIYSHNLKFFLYSQRSLTLPCLLSGKQVCSLIFSKSQGGTSTIYSLFLSLPTNEIKVMIFFQYIMPPFAQFLIQIIRSHSDVFFFSFFTEHPVFISGVFSNSFTFLHAHPNTLVSDVYQTYPVLPI